MTTESSLGETRRAICAVDVLAHYVDARPVNGALLEIEKGASPAICDQDGVLGLIGAAGAINNLSRAKLRSRLQRDGDAVGEITHTPHGSDA